MRKAGRTGRTVVLRLRFDDFGRATRSHTMPRATASTDAILDTARGLVAAAAPLIAERGLTLVGFAVSNIDSDGAQQLELPFCTEHADTVAIDDGGRPGAAALRQRLGDPRRAARPRSRPRDAAPAGLAAASRPLQQLVRGPGVDDPIHRHPVVQRPLGAIAEELQLARARANRCRWRTAQPISSARFSSRVGGSRRSGRELISTAVPLSRQAVNTFSASNFDSGRVPRPPVTSRPVQCPSTSA